MISAAILTFALTALEAETPEVTPPKLLSPETGYSECYPASSRRLGREGRLSVKVTVNADGSLGDVEFPPGTEPWQEKTARCLFLKMQFIAGTRAGKPTSMQVTMPINFELADEYGKTKELAWPKLRSTQEEFEAAYRRCYPANSLAMQEAQYKVTIGTDGIARNIKVVLSGGDPALDEAGTCVIRKLRFQPAQQGGMAVKSTITLPLQLRPPR